ncbi:MAG: CbiX/SirB N-terminal domain-containing protein [Gammaproteobacteria bacterium]|nr:CbiX/SirB N-terminal domain-containing protein [Gammaproteobacteria bacterium]
MSPGESPAGADRTGAASRIALVLVAHGSRRQASNDEVRDLTERLRSLAGARYAAIEMGFLELAEPPLARALDAAAATGAEEIVVVPYFLAAGRHVIDDVPTEIDACRARFPNVRFRVTRHLGAVEGLAEVVLGVAAHGGAGR